jgi:hypothetical protein
VDTWKHMVEALDSAEHNLGITAVWVEVFSHSSC